MPKKTNLSVRELIFADAVLSGARDKDAALKAGYSKKNASVLAWQLLKKPLVKQYIERGRAKTEQRMDLNRARLEREIARIAFADIRKAYNPDGTLKPIHELDDDTAAAVSAVEVEEQHTGRGKNRRVYGCTKRLKLASKNEALAMAMRWHRIGADAALPPPLPSNGDTPVSIQVVFVNAPQAVAQQQPTAQVLPKVAFVDGNK